MVKNHRKKSKKVIFVPKITNTFDFSSQKSQKKSVVFFSDFSHGITHEQTTILSLERYKINLLLVRYHYKLCLLSTVYFSSSVTKLSQHLKVEVVGPHSSQPTHISEGYKEFQNK